VSWFDAARLALDFAATVRAGAKGKSKADELLAELQAHTLEDFARVLEANGNTDRTPPRGTYVPPDAKPVPE
jgi:hypothetical protein